MFTNQKIQTKRNLRWGMVSALLILSLLLPATQPVARAQGCEGEECAQAVDGNPDVARYTTYAMVSSTGASDNSARPVEIEWTTAYETFNAGFNIVVETDDGFEPVNDELIPSEVIDSLMLQSYSYTATLAGDEFYLEHVTIEGESYRNGPFAVGETVGEVVEPEEVDWTSINAASAALAEEREAERVVEINTALDLVHGPAPLADEPLVEQSAGVLGEYNIFMPMIGGGNDGVQSADADAIDVVDGVTVNLLVREEGIYRVTYDDIAAKGIDLSGVPSAYLALTNMGEPVRIRMMSAPNVQGRPTWGPGAYFEFIGEGIETIYTKDNVYVLQVDRSKAFRTFRNLRAPKPKDDAPAFYTESASYEKNLIAWSQTSPIEIDPYSWLLFNRSGNSSVSKSVNFDDITELKSGQPAEIFLEVWGSGNVTHKLEVELNGVPMATEVEYSGPIAHFPTLAVPPSTLVNGENNLKLTVPANAAVQTDGSRLEGFTIHYPRGFVAMGGALAFSGTASRFSVSDLPSRDALVFSVYRNRVWRHEVVTTTPSGGAFEISFHGWGDDAEYYVAAAEEAVSTPAIHVGQSLTTDITSGNANYVMISHPDFIAALEPLRSTRELEGYQVKIVDVLDIYAQFGYSIMGAESIHGYIKHAINNMGTEYILLVGDDTIDPFHYSPWYSVSYMPSLYGPILGWTRAAVEPLFTDVDGDRIPDAKIGRFPVQTPEQTTWIVDKTLNYTPNYTASIFTADSGFSHESDSLSATLPGDWTVNSEIAYLDDMSGTAAHAKLKSEVEAGVTLVSYLGHGSMAKWTLAGQLLNVSKARAIANTGKPALFLQWGCNTSFYGYYTSTVSEALFVSDNRGAVATFAATANTLLSSDLALAQRLTPRVIEEGQTLGSAIQDARLNMISEWGYSEDVINGMTLLGDPTLVIVPAP